MSLAIQFHTIPEMFCAITAAYANTTRPVLMHKTGGQYVGITYGDLKNRVDKFALGLAALGVKREDRVAIIAENRPEWVIADMAIVSLGAIDVPIYPTLTAKQIEYIFKDAGIKIAILSNQFQLNKVQKIFPEVRSLEQVIVMNEKVADAITLPFSKVYEIGESFAKREKDHLTVARQLVRPPDLLTIIYTSGTTGNPKGVMLTHANMVSNIVAASAVIEINSADTLLSFLPLSHSFERMAGYYTAMACGATIAYAESVETVRDNVVEVKPTIVTTVPRLFERIHSRIMKQVDMGSPIKKGIFAWAMNVGSEHARGRKAGKVSPTLAVKHTLADRLVHRKLRERLGGRLRFFVSGGAALGREFGEFFEAMGVTIVEGYGLTESSPVISANLLNDYKFGSVGKPIQGVDVRIAADGEILARGPNIMKGYWNNPEATNDVVDAEGWLHTGDIGMFDDEGFLHITDRKKHLFVSSGGKNIAPQPIENLFLSSKYIEQFVLIGDRRMFLTALIVPDFDAIREFADARGIRYSHDRDLVKLKEITDLIEKDIQQIQKDLANYERVRKFALLERQFTIEDGELTPTQKIRRKYVEERYAHLIEEMYEGVS